MPIGFVRLEQTVSLYTSGHAFGPTSEQEYGITLITHFDTE